jgi:hypothetical protein
VPDDFKGQYVEKIAWGIKYWPRKKNFFKFFFSRNLENKLFLEYMENTLNGEKRIEIKHISVNNRTS